MAISEPIWVVGRFAAVFLLGGRRSHQFLSFVAFWCLVGVFIEAATSSTVCGGSEDSPAWRVPLVRLV